MTDAPEGHRFSAAAFYKAAGALNYTPDQVGQMSLYQFAACVEGFNAAQGGDAKAEPPSNDEFDAMLERHGVVSH